MIMKADQYRRQAELLRQSSDPKAKELAPGFEALAKIAERRQG